MAKKSKNPSLNKLRQKLTELNLHSEFMSVLARKYNLSDPNATGNLITDNKNHVKHPVGRILPESIGADKSLFENNESQGENEKINNLEIFQTKSLDSNAPEKDESSLDTNLSDFDSSLDFSLQDKDTKRADLGNLSPTSSKEKSALDTQGSQSSATTLHPGHNNQVYLDSQSLPDRVPDDASLMESGTRAICTKFELDPEKLKLELREVFQNLSQLITILAPGFTNIYYLSILLEKL